MDKGIKSDGTYKFIYEAIFIRFSKNEWSAGKRNDASGVIMREPAENLRDGKHRMKINEVDGFRMSLAIKAI